MKQGSTKIIFQAEESENHPMINSILDTDLYKLTMQQAVLELYPDAYVSYKFTNRGKHKFNQLFVEVLRVQINKYMPNLYLLDEEAEYLHNACPFLKPSYIEYLKNYRFNPLEVQFILDKDNNLNLDIFGPWHKAILWEVPLMALISELYFKYVDTNWSHDGQIYSAEKKAYSLEKHSVKYADFGTRRRRSFRNHNIVINSFVKIGKSFVHSTLRNESSFLGTSNVFLARKYNIKPIGTMAHEWVQGMATLKSMNRPNYYMLEDWVKVYNADLGIALTDTYGTDSFLSDFNKKFSKLYDGVRHDSGCPFEFTNKIIKHYKKQKIDPMSKTIIFSDGLDTNKAIELKYFCEEQGIKCAFGIGTYFTNDFYKSPSLNMVIKLWSVNGFPVVKLSDAEGKESGDSEAIKIMKWIVKHQLSK